MSFSRLLILAAALAAIPAGAGAESLVDRANRAAASGPTVLRIDPDYGRFRGPRVAVSGDPAIERAVPIPQVMNGGGFGYAGNDYYSDATTVERLGQRRRVNEFFLAPALRSPLP